MKILIALTETQVSSQTYYDKDGKIAPLFSRRGNETQTLTVCVFFRYVANEPLSVLHLGIRDSSICDAYWETYSIMIYCMLMFE